MSPPQSALTLCERPKGVGSYRAEKIPPLFCRTALALKSSSSPQPPSPLKETLNSRNKTAPTPPQKAKPGSAGQRPAAPCSTSAPPGRAPRAAHSAQARGRGCTGGAGRGRKRRGALLRLRHPARPAQCFRTAAGPAAPPPAAPSGLVLGRCALPVRFPSAPSIPFSALLPARPTAAAAPP